MQTSFTADQLRDPDTAEANAVLRRCVHCGFCTATCPTFVLGGDELDSPRGRIYLIKDMLEHGRPATPDVVLHLDRCLSCMACMTTCPSGVNYMHLIDHARAYVESTYTRPWHERLMRGVLSRVLPDPRLFRLALHGARLARPLARLVPGRSLPVQRLRASLALAPARVPRPSPMQAPQVHPAQGLRRARVALLTGCAQSVLAPSINEATIRLLTRMGCEVVVGRVGCCGALTQHMGQPDRARATAAAAIAAWAGETAEEGGQGLDAVVVNTSGCGTTVKEYGHLFRDAEPRLRARAERVAGLAVDVSELLDRLGYAPTRPAPDLTVAYHSACSLQHGQRVTRQPKALLAAAGFRVVEPEEAHLCCGSAGTYNLVQPEIAGQLRARKLEQHRPRPAPTWWRRATSAA